jgi:hypothetical protein
MNIILDCNEKVGIDRIFKPTNRNESLLKYNNDNGVRIVNLATSKNLVVKTRCSRTETSVTAPAPLLMDRLITKFVTYL